MLKKVKQKFSVQYKIMLIIILYMVWSMDHIRINIMLGLHMWLEVVFATVYRLAYAAHEIFTIVETIMVPLVGHSFATQFAQVKSFTWIDHCFKHFLFKHLSFVYIWNERIQKFFRLHKIALFYLARQQGKTFKLKKNLVYICIFMHIHIIHYTYKHHTTNR